VLEAVAVLAAALGDGIDAREPAVADRPPVDTVQLRVDPEALTPRQSLSEIREAAQARLSAS